MCVLLKDQLWNIALRFAMPYFMQLQHASSSARSASRQRVHSSAVIDDSVCSAVIAAHAAFL